MNILIAGAGPVGLAAAVELQRRGFTPRIIDRDGGPSPESRALAVSPRTLDLLEPSGAAALMLERMHRVRRVKLRMGLQTFIDADLSVLPHRFNFLGVLPQSDTERCLIEVLGARGTKVGWNTELKAIATRGEGFDCDGAPADLLIGADGAHSTVRHWLNLGFPGESAPQVFGLADVELDRWPHPWDCIVGSFFDSHVAAFIPMREGFGRFVTSRPDILDALPADAKIGRVVWQAQFKINYRQAGSYQKGNAFLAGDAAHIHSPVGGRGMNLGIEDAAWLAWLIASGRSAEYTGLRHPPGAMVLKQTALNTSTVAGRGTVRAAFLRYILPLIIRLPFTRTPLLRRLAGLDTPPAPWLN